LAKPYGVIKVDAAPSIININFRPNPPIDPIREELVMSLVSIIGPRPNLFDLQGLATTKRLEARQPILTDADLEKIRSISDVADTHFKSRTLDTTFHA
ncbi:glutamate synthase central domain-containing protein, partial [Acinetobacter baumannii]